MAVSMATGGYPTSNSLDHSVFDVFFTNEDCKGLRRNLINSTDDEINKFVTPLITRVRALYLQPLVALVGILGNLAFMFIVWKLIVVCNCGATTRNENDSETMLPPLTTDCRHCTLATLRNHWYDCRLLLIPIPHCEVTLKPKFSWVVVSTQFSLMWDEGG
ncbi:hypothetical protein HOLleu_18156 [Holothuria leucospilota]|uniref:Uncharacterized protein n=1 Tax=Holothuria leucospilota TaxID=206669 RepID=A0A9Q1C3L2_HOLLE|nr:hypothetical protein HOLleu_18156 [Holothuria leucospilota]